MTAQPRKIHGASAEERAAAARPPEVRRDAVFTQVPVEAMTDRMLLPVDRVLLTMLADHDNGSYCCWPTNAALAQEVGCTTRTVRTALRRLERLGWITIEPCLSVPRGQVIRLNWRRPAPGRKAQAKAKAEGGGRKRTSGGEEVQSRGGRKPSSPNPDPVPRTKTRDGSRPGGEEKTEEQTADTLSPEEVAWWAGVAGGGDRTKAKLARAVLKKHAEETAARGNAPG
jgi:hypothetical protein